jgi:hypothetical protein
MTLLTGIALTITVSCGALIGLTFASTPLEVFTEPSFYLWVMLACGLVFIAAVIVHPDSRSDGLHARADLGTVARSAPFWTWMLVGACIVTVLWCAHEGPPGPSRFTVDRANLVGRPDRWRGLMAFGMVFSAFACMTAASAERRKNAWMNVP